MEGQSKAGRKFEIKAKDPVKPMKMKADVSSVTNLKGKHPLYLVFNTPSDKSLCTLHRIQFEKQ